MTTSLDVAGHEDEDYEEEEEEDELNRLIRVFAICWRAFVYGFISVLVSHRVSCFQEGSSMSPKVCFLGLSYVSCVSTFRFHIGSPVSRCSGSASVSGSLGAERPRETRRRSSASARLATTTGVLPLIS